MSTEEKALRIKLSAYIDPSTKEAIQKMVDKTTPEMSSEGRVVDTAVAELAKKSK